MRAPGFLVVALLALAACPRKKEEAPSPPAAAVAPKPKTAEVEFFGTFKPGTVKAARAVFVAMQEPCSPLPAEAHLYGQKDIDVDKLFAEFFPPQGSKGYLCVYGLDAAGKVVGWAAFAKNPVTFQGEGEVVIDHIDVTLEPLAEATALPKGI